MDTRAHEPLTVWAPKASAMRLAIGDEELPMRDAGDGWWEPAAQAPAGEHDYGFLIDDRTDALPDPRSRRQPNGVHERSRTWDPNAHAWGDASWSGRQLAGWPIYEMHVGTFTPGGTLDSAIERIPHLLSLGVGFVEIMPVNAFNGTHNWGYDGVLWYAVQETYGGPDAYQRFVDACHQAGLGVLQDVVYNHLGAGGNYLPQFAPYLSTEGNTWGQNIALAEPEVRRYVIENALFWMREMHVDGLRLDAVHALVDDSPMHVLEELAIETSSLAAHLGRPLTLIAESDMNDARLVMPREAGGYGLEAQWSDDFHHAVHVALTGETAGYYADFEPLSALAKVLERGFFHDGSFSSFRGREHGAPIDTRAMPSWRLVVCSQNHDQIGNRAAGDRLSDHLTDEQVQIAALLTMAGPYTPMLFQGEEWAASTPFQFFTSHPEEWLAKATAAGRIAEFELMGWDETVVPDPQDLRSFERSRLQWGELSTGRHAATLEAYQRLAVLRRELPALTDPSFLRNRVWVDEDARTLRLLRGCRVDVTSTSVDAHPADGGEVTGSVELLVNLGPDAWMASVAEGAQLRFATGSAVSLDGGTVTLPPGSGALVTLPE